MEVFLRPIRPSARCWMAVRWADQWWTWRLCRRWIPSRVSFRC